MKNLFMSIITFLNSKGDVTAANLYKGYEYSNIEVEIDGCVYTITIRKEDKPSEN